MSLFDLPSGPRSINGGAAKYQAIEILPTSMSVGPNVRVGTGAANGTTTFQFTEDAQSWIPALSYFNIIGHFTQSNGTSALAATTDIGVGYVDNWCASLFDQISMDLGGETLENVQYVPQVDTAMLYASCDKGWLDTFGSASGVGESLVTRIRRSSTNGTGYNSITANWRPCISLFDIPYAMPPTSALWRIVFTWSSLAEARVAQRATSTAGVPGTTWRFYIDSFRFYKATVAADPSVPRPISGFIELNPVRAYQLQLNGGSAMSSSVTLPQTCNRMLIGFQDASSAGSPLIYAQGTNGIIPITSFLGAFTSTTTVFSAYLQNILVTFPELMYSAPQPQYNLQPGNADGAQGGWSRAYQDFINICRGGSAGTEGSIPFGNYDINVGNTIVAINTTVANSIVNTGDPSNKQQLWLTDISGTSVAATYANQCSRYGWLGMCPGPIFAIPVMRAPGQIVSTASLQVTLNTTAVSMTATVIMPYSAGLEVSQNLDGKYTYTYHPYI